MRRRNLLYCGIASSALYVAMNIIGVIQWEGYSPVSQSVSELFAIGAPSRPIWVVLGIVYQVLVSLFAWGILASAGRNRPLRIAGSLLLAYGVIGFLAPFFPMHQRGSEGTSTDTMHIILTIATVAFMMSAILFGAAALGKRFRLYSIATVVPLLVFGALAGLDGPNVAANLPTPWLGVTERINIGVFLLWVVVLAIVLLRAPVRTHPQLYLKVGG
jgi:hypothetical protein